MIQVGMGRRGPDGIRNKGGTAVFIARRKGDPGEPVIVGACHMFVLPPRDGARIRHAPIFGVVLRNRGLQKLVTRICY